MRIDITVARTQPLPPGALDALSQELARRIDEQFPDAVHHIKVRYASTGQLSVLGGGKETRDQISDILQQTWESADDWFMTD
ncbi:MAG: DNA damage-inducible protein I [Enterobacterales bacterium endosymbiont of Blomia tropicalis]|uniref:DNA damage-inducible protein I n=1 Tax=Mixta mediterraneensis TaxID=2758443 RepID=UPI0025A82499|nr:DNA damage-inducible protein I [Mixta mediterraneensis]MDL4914539.1 DNA damage-inducible protein I [Mixta mediterraneensis]